MASFFRIRNFERFQHYKDRNPPWIRLYGALWRDRAFFRLPDATKAHLIGLFALAARLDNRIPDDPEWLAHELCASEAIDLEALIASGFLLPEHLASDPNHECERPAPSSVSVSVSDSDLIREGGSLEIATEAIPGDSPARQSAGADARGSEAHQRRKARLAATRWPEGFALDELMREFAANLGIDAYAEFEAWRDDCAAHDRHYTDWHAAWRGRCRNALRFAPRVGARGRASPGENAMDLALRRLGEASARERSGSVA
jgi:hypothetical protein